MAEAVRWGKRRADNTISPGIIAPLWQMMN